MTAEREKQYREIVERYAESLSRLSNLLETLKELYPNYDLKQCIMRAYIDGLINKEDYVKLIDVYT